MSGVIPPETGCLKTKGPVAEHRYRTKHKEIRHRRSGSASVDEADLASFVVETYYRRCNSLLVGASAHREVHVGNLAPSVDVVAGEIELAAPERLGVSTRGAHVSQSLRHLFKTLGSLGGHDLLDDRLGHLEGGRLSIDATESEDKADEHDGVEERKRGLSEVSPETPFVDRFGQVGVQSDHDPDARLYEVTPVMVLGVREDMGDYHHSEPRSHEQLEKAAHAQRSPGDEKPRGEGQDVGLDIHANLLVEEQCVVSQLLVVLISCLHYTSIDT